MFRGLINYFHHCLAKSTLIVKFFLLLRNQCYAVIGYYLVNSPNFFLNGESLIVDSLAKDCKLIFDVGANKGSWSEYFLNKNAVVKIFLFEPSFNAFHLLENKFKEVNNVILINKGLAEKERKNIFFEEPECGETSSVVRGVSRSDSKKTEIELTTVDLITKKYGLQKIDYLKIDVEGYDLHVIKGALENLKQKNIGYIQFEYNSSWAMAGSTLIDAILFLNELEYRTFLLRKDGLYNFNYSVYGEFYRYSNFLALPDQSIPLIKSLIKGRI